ncbi:glycosyltransferase family A protein [Micromonospora sp. WMMD1102]|uniref:glycosyltransferase family 2 protein n=1 Tax=Micromonospora sp. WMMD1102 TaxID=3016105 RepID=UPI0024153EE6|nr:glycosyltransferase family A protein [Micromonospora sp. WMMD1102]MDG4784353.1 glycosyltransferase family A protein [Micromonospora sp. WMMD1102]MDG4784426.1 glycosyltransferase family A protein [Micromonospora sp. WMMD1102]
MKVLSPAVTIVLASHMKPYLRDSIESVLAQTRRDMQVLVVDSGQWIGQTDGRSAQMASIYAEYHGHPLIEWVTTGEGPELRRHRCPIGWTTNEVIRAGLIRGRYVSTFYDDDQYGPTFVQRMAGYLDDHPDARAVWCSQDRVRLDPDGTETLVGVIRANGPRGPGQFDCQVDGAQIMIRREVLDAIGDPWLPEDPGDSCRHSDGIFLERLASVVGTVPAIGEVLLRHRFTPLSTYTPSPR